MTKIKLMSFNTQHCLGYLARKVDYDLMARTIMEQGADIVGLNEMFDEAQGAKYGAQTKRLSDLTDLKNHYFAKAIDDSDGPYGNGILSRYKIKEVKTHIIPDPNPRANPKGYYETRCVLVCDLENGLRVIVTHFGLEADEQENAVKEALKHIRDEKCVLMGDFNLEPSSPILSPLFERLNDTATGFCENTPSFPSDAPRIKIDYILSSKDIAVSFAQIPEVISSDHRPHIAIIEL